MLTKARFLCDRLHNRLYDRAKSNGGMLVNRDTVVKRRRLLKQAPLAYQKTDLPQQGWQAGA